MRQRLLNALVSTSSAKIEEMFVASAQQTLELAAMLGMTCDDFMETMYEGWKIDRERRDKDRENT